MNTHYDVYYFDNFIERHAALINKPVVYFRSVGWNTSSDVDAINASWEAYEDILPGDLWTALKNSEHVFIECDNVNTMMEWLDDNLPQSQASCITPENYIFYALYNAEGQQIATNE